MHLPSNVEIRVVLQDGNAIAIVNTTVTFLSGTAHDVSQMCIDV